MRRAAGASRAGTLGHGAFMDAGISRQGHRAADYSIQVCANTIKECDRGFVAIATMNMQPPDTYMELVIPSMGILRLPETIKTENVRLYC